MAQKKNQKTIFIIGGGVAGLSAAHELAKFYDQIHVFEAGSHVGGKARSQDVRELFKSIQAKIPQDDITKKEEPFWIGEHGFRLFPHTYRHVIETMKEISVAEGGNENVAGIPVMNVADRLVGSTEAGFAFEGALRRVIRPFPHGGTALLRAMRESFGNSPFGTEMDYALFGWYLLKYITSCPERRDGEYDDLSWLEYVGVDRGGYSTAFEPLLKAIPRGLNAMKPDVCSARSFGNMMLRFAFDFSGERGLHMEQVLAGPTTESWLEPWRKQLEDRGVKFHFHHRLEGFSFDEGIGKISRLHFRQLQKPQGPNAEIVNGLLVDGEDGLKSTPLKEGQPSFHYAILAVPIEVAQSLLKTPKAKNDPSRNEREVSVQNMVDFDIGLQRLRAMRSEPTAPMVGLQFYLREEMAPLFGHMFYPGSAWSLTSVSQQPFWAAKKNDLAKIIAFNRANPEEEGKRQVKGVLSVIVSNWKAVCPARSHIEQDGKLERVATPLPAFAPIEGPPKAAFAREVWFQLKDALNEPGRPPRLTESMLIGFPFVGAPGSEEEMPPAEAQAQAATADVQPTISGAPPAVAGAQRAVTGVEAFGESKPLELTPEMAAKEAKKNPGKFDRDHGRHVNWLDRLLAKSVHVDTSALAEKPDDKGRTRISAEHQTPLFIHPRGSYALRPEAQLRIPNLLLASDYVRTDTDLATMEAANEAARRAVLAILWRDPDARDKEQFPKLFRQSDPPWALAAQAFDRILYRAGQGHFMDLPDLLSVLTAGAFTNVTNIARQFMGQEPVRGAPPALAPERLLERAERLIIAVGEVTGRTNVSASRPRNT